MFFFFTLIRLKQNNNRIKNNVNKFLDINKNNFFFCTSYTQKNNINDKENYYLN